MIKEQPIFAQGGFYTIQKVDNVTLVGEKGKFVEKGITVAVKTSKKEMNL